MVAQLREGLSQFHRGVSRTLVILATLLLFVEAKRHPEAQGVTLLGTLFVAAAFSGVQLLWPLHLERQ